ncbi:response regulator [Uliginosibacterium sp. H3]|uniref:histidine kinase n=1 Tax=Uliginosibacterium silvisoli TaxID=3114758 RepID=A0ABU6K8E4_9RHOO|nr:response regulator [Uliginosibacterium sp. H3]
MAQRNDLIAGVGNKDGQEGVENITPANILIVDDLTEKLLVFKTVLEDLGQNLVMVRSGAEALREILQREFAVILLDVNMPDIDGLETASMIRRYKRTAHTPIIFITSYADEIQTTRGYSLGAVDYILSPVVPEVLRSKVMVFVQLYEMQRRTRFLAEERITFMQAQTAREAAEETTRRSNFLSRASRELSASLEMNSAAHRLVELVTPELADLTVLLVDMGDDPGMMLMRSATTRLYNPETCTLSPYQDLPIDMVEACVESAYQARAIRLTWTEEQMAARPATLATAEWRGDLNNLLVVPLRLGERQLGVLALLASDFTAADVATVEELASRAAIAFENAHLYLSLQREILKSRQAEEKLQEASRRKDEFLAMLSHELRNPLAPIRNAVEVIRRVAAPEPTLIWARDVVDRQVSHLSRLIEELLDVSRISQGKIALRKEAVELARIIAHGVETVRPLIDARGHNLFVDVPPAPVWLDADFARLSQVTSNLLNNAAKYTADGGEISLVASVSEGVVTISVKDNGIGIAPTLMPRIFELFSQGERSLDRSQGGLGVGLTLVQRLVEQHDGQVEAVSGGIGRGSEFIVTLPCLTENLFIPRNSARTTADLLPAGRVRVLVVDDNADSAESVALFLRLEGHETTSALNGLQALELAQSFKPDVMVIDIGLPGLNGYELAQRLRASQDTAQMLLIALTGYGQESDLRTARQAGFDHHFIKPVSPEEIHRLIATRVAANGNAAPGGEAAQIRRA